MNAAALAMVFAPALALGSFLNVVVARVPARQSLLRPPSSCGSCGPEIRWRDNIPVALIRRCSAAVVATASATHLARRIRSSRPLTALLIVACVAVYGLTAGGGARGRLLRRPGRALGDRRESPDRPEPDRPAGGGCRPSSRTRRSTRAPPGSSGRSSPRAALPRRARVSQGSRHGRRQAELLLGAMLGASVTVAFMIGLFTALVRPRPRLPARRAGEEDGDPARPLPVARRGPRALLRRRDPRRLPRGFSEARHHVKRPRSRCR